jgi:hypothetical protein
MMFNQLIVGVAGIAALFGVWVAVQALVRRHDPDYRGAGDVLACRMCGADGSCHCGLRALVREPATREGDEQ